MPDTKSLSEAEKAAGALQVEHTPDVDPAETSEWLDSLNYVLDSKGPERAKFLIEALELHARRMGVALPVTATTPYINTIPAHQQPRYPGNREIERRIKSIIRWNAMAMVVRANKRFTRAWEDTFRRLPLRRRCTRSASEPLLSRPWRRAATTATWCTSKGHASPGHLLPRLFRGPSDARQNLDNFRRELRAGRWAVVVSASLADAEFLGISHGVHGTGADHVDLSGAIQSNTCEDRGIRKTPPSAGSGRSWVTGNAMSRNRWERSRWRARERLDNLIFVINCNLQRLDGPVRGNGKIIQELEADLPRRRLECDQGMSGVPTGIRSWREDESGLLLEQADGRGRRRPVPEVYTTACDGGALHPRALLR